MVLSKEFSCTFPLDEMVKEWEADYKKEMGRLPGKADFNDFYNDWEHRIYNQMFFSDVMQKFLIWKASYNEIWNAWRDYWKDRK